MKDLVLIEHEYLTPLGNNHPYTDNTVSAFQHSLYQNIERTKPDSDYWRGYLQAYKEVLKHHQICFGVRPPTYDKEE